MSPFLCRTGKDMDPGVSLHCCASQLQVTGQITDHSTCKSRKSDQKMQALGFVGAPCSQIILSAIKKLCEKLYLYQIRQWFSGHLSMCLVMSPNVSYINTYTVFCIIDIYCIYTVYVDDQDKLFYATVNKHKPSPIKGNA